MFFALLDVGEIGARAELCLPGYGLYEVVEVRDKYCRCRACRVRHQGLLAGEVADGGAFRGSARRREELGVKQRVPVNRVWLPAAHGQNLLDESPLPPAPEAKVVVIRLVDANALALMAFGFSTLMFAAFLCDWKDLGDSNSDRFGFAYIPDMLTWGVSLSLTVSGIIQGLNDDLLGFSSYLFHAAMLGTIGYNFEENLLGNTTTRSRNISHSSSCDPASRTARNWPFSNRKNVCATTHPAPAPRVQCGEQRGGGARIRL